MTLEQKDQQIHRMEHNWPKSRDRHAPTGIGYVMEVAFETVSGKLHIHLRTTKLDPYLISNMKINSR